MTFFLWQRRLLSWLLIGGSFSFFLGDATAKPNTVAKPRLLAPASLKPLSWGDPKAPIVISEYSAPTCHICGLFSRYVLPELEKKYIQKNQVRLNVYCLPYNRVDLKISMLIYHMPNPKEFYLFLLQNQDLWLDQRDPLKAARALAYTFKMTPKEVTKAFKNPRTEEGLIRQRIMCEQGGAITGLPVFKIGKTMIPGLLPWEDFDRILQKAQAHLKKEGSLKNFQVRYDKK